MCVHIHIYICIYTHQSLSIHLLMDTEVASISWQLMLLWTLGACTFFFFLRFTNYLFIYLFLAVLGLRFCVRAFSSCGKWGPLLIAVHGPLTIAASLVAEYGLQTRRLSNCGSWAWLLRGMWDLPRPGLESVSPALAGRFSTTAPPGKPQHVPFWISVFGFFGYIPRRILLGHVVILILVFWETSIVFSTLAAPIYSPPNSVWGILFLHILATIFYLCSFWW